MAASGMWVREMGPPTVTLVSSANGTINAVAWLDSLSDGTPWYMAHDPRMPGCMADGATADEAIATLNEIRPEFIALLIEEGVPLPEGVSASEAEAA